MVGTVLVAALVGSPLLSTDPTDGTDAPPDPVVVEEYRTDLRVDRAGVMTAVETLTTSFPDGRHGLFRFFDVADPRDAGGRLVPRDVRVTLDGRDVPVAYSWEQGRRFRVARIGDPDTTLPAGRHVFEVAYRVDGVLAPDGDSRSRLDWQLVPGGWQTRITRSRHSVTLPAPAREAGCTVGAGGACAVRGAGGTTLTVDTGPLAPRTPVTLRAAAALPAPARATLPWPVAWDAVLGGAAAVALALVVIAALTLALGVRLARASREPLAEVRLAVAPPEGLGPVQTAYVFDERVPPQALVATLLHLADRGLVRLTRHDDGGWSVEGLGGDWASVDEVSAQVGERLGLRRAGSLLLVDDDVETGRLLREARNAIGPSTAAWAQRAGLVARAPRETAGQVLVVVAAVAAVALVAVRPGGATLWALPFATFVLGGAGLLRRGVGRRRTPAGQALRAEAEGFRRGLCGPDGDAGASGEPAVQPAHAPFAVALGCAEAWARGYAATTAGAGPRAAVPSVIPWYGVLGAHGTAGSSPAPFTAFESSLGAAIGAYEASVAPSSSPSSGGGYSGGGSSAGGGGGGGSW